MREKYYLIYGLFFIMTVACDTSKNENHPQVEEEIVTEMVSPSDLLLQECLVAHGGDKYEQAHYSFTFRGKLYTFNNNNTNYYYSVTSVDSNGVTRYDELNNEEFTRTIDGVISTLSDEKKEAHASALNSVIYFATLPHKLNDKAVITTLGEKTTILEEDYDELKVSFIQEGGGEDFEDEYSYWVNCKTKKIDYLAYNYQVNGGGVRFRSGFNKRIVDGITFQDYVNYEAPIGTPLADLPKLYEQDSLKELSKIVTEELISLNK